MTIPKLWSDVHDKSGRCRMALGAVSHLHPDIRQQAVSAAEGHGGYGFRHQEKCVEHHQDLLFIDRSRRHSTQ